MTHDYVKSSNKGVKRKNNNISIILKRKNNARVQNCTDNSILVLVMVMVRFQKCAESLSVYKF